MNLRLSNRYQHRIQLLIFYLLLIAVLTVAAKLTLATDTGLDWTAAKRHSLSAQTIELLTQLDQPLDIEVFISPEHDYVEEIAHHLHRYQSHSDQLSISFTDPASAPQRVKQLLIQQQGEMHIRSANQFERVLDMSEQSLSNALYRVTRTENPHLLFVQGHGERAPNSEANFGLSQWTQQLSSKGYEVTTFHPARNPKIEDTVDLLVIASSERPWLTGEVELVKTYLNRGGNLLWLVEPDSSQHLTDLAAALGIKILPGMVIDPLVRQLGIEDPRFVLISDYANHPVAKASSDVSLLPTATALKSSVENSWQVTELLRSQPDSWLMLSAVEDSALDNLQFNAELDLPGPLTMGLLLEKKINDTTQQRIAVIGDGDFVSNTYLGNAANLDLSLSLVNWLTQQRDTLTIPPKKTQDSQLSLSVTQSLVIAIGFLMVLPALLILTGLLIWWRRRRQ